MRRGNPGCPTFPSNHRKPVSLCRPPGYRVSLLHNASPLLFPALHYELAIMASLSCLVKGPFLIIKPAPLGSSNPLVPKNPSSITPSSSPLHPNLPHSTSWLCSRLFCFDILSNRHVPTHQCREEAFLLIRLHP